MHKSPRVNDSESFLKKNSTKLAQAKCLIYQQKKKSQALKILQIKLKELIREGLFAPHD